MMYENDKLNIPEKYKQMSVHELKCEKERIFLEIKQNKNITKNELKHKKGNIVFHF